VILRSLFILWLLLAGPVLMLIFGNLNLEGDWSNTNRRSANIAPSPETPEAIIQLYSARNWNWRGAFFVHTWFASKRSQQKFYNVYQVVGWHSAGNNSMFKIEKDIPDRYWFGQRPQLIKEIRGGKEIDQLIDKLEKAVAKYPYPNTYRSWPGPNSNTFTAYIARHLPELRIELPPTAIGKDFLPKNGIVAVSPSGTGVQLSLYGVAGVMIGWEEGIELNILTLDVGVDPLGLAIKLPGIGRVGWT